MFLRVTWHPEHSAFVVSHWDHEVCVAATRVAAGDVADVVALLTNGLTDALAAADAKPPVAQSPRVESPLQALWQQVLARLPRRRPVADVIEFPDRRPPSAGEQPRWKSRER